MLACETAAASLACKIRKGLGGLKVLGALRSDWVNYSVDTVREEELERAYLNKV